MVNMTEAQELGSYYMTLDRDENGSIIDFHNVALVGSVIAKLEDSAKPLNKELAAALRMKVEDYFRNPRNR